MEKNKPESDSPKACQSLIPSRAPWTAMAAWDHAVFPMRNPLAAAPNRRHIPVRPFIPGGRCSQGGVKVPTGGKGRKA
ncbi:hypothetical protein ACVIQY_004724 [Bradyrhizobium sp. USDA 3051]